MIALFLVAFVVLLALAFKVRGQLRSLEQKGVILPKRPPSPPPRIFIPEGRSRSIWERWKRRGKR